MYFYIFQRLIHIFKDDLTKFQDNSRTKGTFFQGQGQFFPGLCEPCKRMSHILCHINPQIQFVDICCSHGMSLAVFIHCDLDLRSQFLEKCTNSRSPILFMVAFHIWYVDMVWRVTKCFQVTVTLTSGFCSSKVELRAYLYII